jgi:rhamnosyltransferase
MKENWKDDDVVIPTYKPGIKFTKLIDHLHRQTVAVRHIYVINTEEEYYNVSATDKYDDVVVTHITKAEFDHGGTRNMGAKMSDADFVLFMTDDAIPKNPHLVAELLSPFANDNVAASFARQLGDKKADYLEYSIRCFNYPNESRLKTKEDIDELGIKTFFCSNVCAMYKKSAYEEAGGFVLKAIFNEDMMMAAKLIDMGYGVYYAADARVEHWHNYSAIAQFHRNFDVAASQQMENGYLKDVKSESEGIKLVKWSVKHLFMSGRIYLIPKFIWQSGFKYMGYKLGARYKKLPKWLVKKLSMNPTFWKKYYSGEA